MQDGILDVFCNLTPIFILFSASRFIAGSSVLRLEQPCCLLGVRTEDTIQRQI